MGRNPDNSDTPDVPLNANLALLVILYVVGALAQMVSLGLLLSAIISDPSLGLMMAAGLSFITLLCCIVLVWLTQ